MTPLLGALVCACLLLAPLSRARDLYVVPASFFVTQDQHLAVSIQRGDDFLSGGSAPTLDRLRDTDEINPVAFFNIENLHSAGSAVSGDVLIKSKGTLVLTARTLPVVDKVSSTSFQDYVQSEKMTITLNQPPPAEVRVRHSGYAKALIQSEAADDFFNHVVGFLIEIVPALNPYALHPGDGLPIQVLFAGKPGADLRVEAVRVDGDSPGTKVAGRTSPDGKITIPIAGPGKWRLHTTEIYKCSEQNVADWEILTASLTFEIR